MTMSPETHEIAEAMILVDKARSEADRALRHGVSQARSANHLRLLVEEEAAADMGVLQGSPSSVDITRIVARYAYVHAEAASAALGQLPAGEPPPDTVGAVLLDWAGTVAHLESSEEWLSGALAEAGIVVPARERAAWLRQAEAVGLPSVRRPADLSAHCLAAWWRRDLDPQAHQDIYTGLLKEAGMPWPEAAGALYRRTISAAGWRIDPAARRALASLHRKGVTFPS